MNLAAYSSFTGGSDIITGGTAFGAAATPNDLYGDAQTVHFYGDGTDSFLGGNDTLTGGEGAGGFFAGTKVNVLYGDVSSIALLAAGAIYGSFQGGYDTLIGGTGATDHMYGDWEVDNSGTAVGGADTFVIGVGGGFDTIFDFRPTDESIIGTDELGVDIILHETVVLTGFKLTLDTNGDSMFNFADLAPLWTTVFGDLALSLDGDGNDTGDVLIFSGFTMASELSADDFVFV